MKQHFKTTLKGDTSCQEWKICSIYKMKNKTRLYYDEEGDFLEISVGEPTECSAEEIEPGVFFKN